MDETIKLKGGSDVEVDLSKETSKCRDCKEEIHWAKTKNGKWNPIKQDENGEWISHFSDCKFADNFRKKKGTDA